MMYVATFSGVAVSAVQDLFAILAPSDAVVVIHEVVVTSDADETSEQLPITLKRGATAAGSGGSAVTPVPLEAGASAAGSTVRANDTTQAGTGTIVNLRREGVNLLGAGFRYLPTPETRIVLSPGIRLVVSLDAAPSASRNLSGTLVFEELGG